MPTSKAKIGFSIDSIVGDDVNKSSKDKNEIRYVNEYQTEIARALRITDHPLHADLNRFRSEVNTKDMPHQMSTLMEYSMKRESSTSPPSSYSQQTLPSEENLPRRSRSPSPHRTTIGPEPTPLQFMNDIHSPSGPIRPMPLVPPPNLVDAKQMPQYLGLPTNPPHPNSHLLQAQFQLAAAALAQRQAVEQSFPPNAQFRHTPPQHMVNPVAMGRESYQLYPWLIGRSPRFFSHGFPGSK